ncbi:MAG: hypothetical protein RBS49_00850 [Sphaerochaeta sp.]|nr:hypothetical protein [Sphaerochaeta sp.]
MAYCVQCGVKLAEGVPVCPLCNTPVVLPPTMVEQQSEPLFPKPLGQPKTGGVTKVRKGIIELTVSLAVVSILAVGLSLGLSGLGRYTFIPTFSIAMATTTLVVSLLSKPTYVRQATIALIGIGLLVIGIDLGDLSLSWSPIAAMALPVLWIVAVAPATAMKRQRILPLLILAVLLYLLVINLTVSGELTWFWPVALPTVVVFILLAILLILFLTKRKGSIIPLADVVLATMVVLFGSISALDLFLTGYQRGFFALRWSTSLLWTALVVLLFLLAITCSRRLRRYFTSHVNHT